MQDNELLGPNGTPIGQYLQYAAGGRPKNPKPVVGDAFPQWSTINADFLHLPGGGTIAFDTSRLTLKNFRKMAENYQIGSSLNLLMFMLHQLDFHVEGSDPKVNDWCEYNLREVWTRTVRSMSSAFTYGYSANAVEWENDSHNGKLRLNKVKDLLPEECEVNWKWIDGTLPSDAPINAIPPKIPIFDGIRKCGTMYTIPVTNSFWYPLLMTGGDYGGRKLLRSAFQPWFFSSLIHLYQNKYFERFGEPVPIGRAPYNSKVKVGDKTVYSHELMRELISMIRSRAAIVLPDDKTPASNSDTNPSYDYQIEYLEAQLRGADFERYLTRLDEEMSLALFTPLLMLRTTDQGGFNQAIAQEQVYLWMLNAIAGDWKEYIDRYILRPMAVFNFGIRASLPTIKFRKLGTAQQETLRSIVQAMIAKDIIRPDVRELGEHLGLTLEEIDVLTGDGTGGNTGGTDGTAVGNTGTDTGSGDKRTGRPEKLKTETPQPGVTTKPMARRLRDQVERIYKRDWELATLLPSLGYRRQLAGELEARGHNDPQGLVALFDRSATDAIIDIAGLGKEYFPTADSFMQSAEGILQIEMEKIYNAD